MHVLLLGFGNVGRKMAQILTLEREKFPRLGDLALTVVGICTRSRGAVAHSGGIDLRAALERFTAAGRFGPEHPTFSALTGLEAVRTLDYDVLVELTVLDVRAGGEPALSHVREALRRGRHVVTANKGPLAFAYQELAALARERGVRLLHESTVIDGAPLFGMVERSLRAGAGRKRVEKEHPEVARELRAIVEETTAGDPMSMLKWTSKSTRSIAEELTRRGYPMTWVTAARCLRDMGYSLQGNRKSIEGRQHPDRDGQFRYINSQVKAFLGSGDPVISVDTKKKELVGSFRNAGRTWRRRGQPQKVRTHDFPTLAEGDAYPYGTYDIRENRALVNVGVTHDTAEFAVESIRRWWRMLGRRTYPEASRLLICADAGGSNGNRRRTWKVHVQRFADEIGAPISVCHYPPGTSKWNKIEHRLFSFISMNWRGRPLVSYETIVNLIGSTRTRTGLRVKAVLETHDYEVGVQVPEEEMQALRLQGHAFHPEWNYTVSPGPKLRRSRRRKPITRARRRRNPK